MKSYEITEEGAGRCERCWGRRTLRGDGKFMCHCCFIESCRRRFDADGKEIISRPSASGTRGAE